MPSPARQHAEHVARGELAYQVAPDGSAVFPPRLAQPGTGAPLGWAISAGHGSVYSTTVVRRRGEAPYNLALIDLDEGFRMMSRVEGVEPEAVAIGLRVVASFRDDVAVFVAP